MRAQECPKLNGTIIAYCTHADDASVRRGDEETEFK